MEGEGLGGQPVDDEKILSHNYETNEIRKPESVADLGRETLALHHVFGRDYSRRGNLHLIEDDRIIYATSSAIVLEYLSTGQKEYLLSLDENGIGCVVVHPSMKYFAVGGKGNMPNIYIYSYPDLKIRKILRNGAERGYACMNFSSIGDKLASVSMAPDYMLTIWDWESEQMGLHSKAFGQDIWNVQFSMDDPRRLTTSGIGHIRFWKMAATFTGLKLQGYIGKFGKVDLSDIEQFIELPDGKVISGTETGSLLLWEGNFIKCRFTQVGGKLCHNGPISYINYDREEKCIISASLDGTIKWWDFNAIDTAEVDSDQSMDFELLPLAEYIVSESCGIRNLLDSKLIGNKRYFVIIDTTGRAQSLQFTWMGEADSKLTKQPKLCEAVIGLTEKQQNQLRDDTTTFEYSVGDKEEFTVERSLIGTFHAGAITGMDTCPVDHIAATCGDDGVVRLIDYLNRKEITYQAFSTPATCLRWVNSTLDPSGKSFIVGFEDGVLRILTISMNEDNEIYLSKKFVLKPHNSSICDISYSESGEYIATSGKDGIIFIHKCEPFEDSFNGKVRWEPLRFIRISNNTDGKSIYCERTAWSPHDKYILASCSDSIIREFDLNLIFEPEPISENEQVTFEIELPKREILPVVEVLTSSKSGVLNIVKKSEPVAETTAEEGSPESPTKSKSSEPQNEPTKLNIKINQALYSLNRSSGGFIGSASLSSNQHILCEGDLTDTTNTRELTLGLYSADGKDFLKTPLVTSLSYGWNRNYLLIGLADGTVFIRPSGYLEIFAKSVAHNSTRHGVSSLAQSFDDRFLLSAGKDGCLVIHRVRLDILTQRGPSLYKDIDAGVFGSELIKNKPKSTDEPQYLTTVTTYLSSNEDSLFSATISGKEKTENILTNLVAETFHEVNDLPPNAYSIQDNRLKMEEDAKLSAADELKGRVIASIRTLRRDYEKILMENDTIPSQVRLTIDELTVDNDFFAKLKIKGEEMLEEVHRECAYEMEKAERQYEKVAKVLRCGLLMEEIPLRSFNLPNLNDKTRKPDSIVWSLRVASLDNSVLRIIKEVRDLVRKEELDETQQKTNELAQKKALEAMDEMKMRLLKKDEDSVLKTDGTRLLTEKLGGKNENESTAALRRLKRKERKEALSKHFLEKPSEDDDDIRDVQAIKQAEKTIGDYKLKSADDYDVPEGQRINALKKLRQMAILEESMMKVRLKFNERFLALRTLKREFIYTIRRDNKRIQEIDRELNQSHLSTNLWQPELDPHEFPEDYDEITDEELKEFIQISKGKAWKDVNAPLHRVILGNKIKINVNQKTQSFALQRQNKEILPIRESRDQLYNFLSDSNLITYTPPRLDDAKYYEVNENILYSMKNIDRVSDPEQIPPQQLNERLTNLPEHIPILKFTKTLMKSRMQLPNPTKTQAKLIQQRKQQLEFERKMILQSIDQNVQAFKDAIDELRLDRHQVISDLKLAEFKLITLYQEYKLLQTFENRDNALQQKQIRCKNEENDIINLSTENKQRLESKLEEIQSWNDKLQAITNDFKTILPENHPYVETLTKIFRKKIKRNKNGEDENEDDDYDNNEDDEDDDEDDEEIEDICPPGCDQIIFEKILELREKKLDTEEICTELQKNIDELKRTAERLKQREKQIAKEAIQTEAEVTQFQLQKQAALNQIRVIVPLRLSQIYSFEFSGAMTGPTDKPLEGIPLEEAEKKIQELKNIDNRQLVSNITMKSHTLFTSENLIRLKERINELHDEIAQAKDNFKLLHKEQGLLLKERESKEKETGNWKKKCRDLQLLKFGREIDLDELEAFSDRTKEMEVEATLEEDRDKFEKESLKLVRDVDEAKSKLLDITKVNTKLLDEVARLSEMKMQISNELNAPGQNVAPPSAKEDFRAEEERKRIKAYVQFQATELQSLRTELNMLKRKEAPIFSQTAPMIPSIAQSPSLFSSNNQSSQKKGSDDLVLPPIPTKFTNNR